MLRKPPYATKHGISISVERMQLNRSIDARRGRGTRSRLASATLAKLRANLSFLSVPDRSEPLDDRRMVNFTPRLGRESGEELLSAPPPPPPPPPPVQLAAALRSPPFAPRLGRGLLFSPRMGRSSARAPTHPWLPNTSNNPPLRWYATRIH